ncbi:MAG: hypothetical protein ACRDT8_12995 [Micromonosporaceae bacterium]
MTSPPNVEYGDPAIALPNQILRSVVGSGVHGIAIEGTDDRDEMGVYIEPAEHVLGKTPLPPAAEVGAISAWATGAARRHWNW